MYTLVAIFIFIIMVIAICLYCFNFISETTCAIIELIAVISLLFLLIVYIFNINSDIHTCYSQLNVYTTSGELIEVFDGDITNFVKDKNSVEFDFKGKHYIYYNCFVEAVS